MRHFTALRPALLGLALSATASTAADLASFTDAPASGGVEDARVQTTAASLRPA